MSFASALAFDAPARPRPRRQPMAVLALLLGAAGGLYLLLHAAAHGPHTALYQPTQPHGRPLVLGRVAAHRSVAPHHARTAVTRGGPPPKARPPQSLGADGGESAARATSAAKGAWTTAAAAVAGFVGLLVLAMRRLTGHAGTEDTQPLRMELRPAPAALPRGPGMDRRALLGVGTAAAVSAASGLQPPPARAWCGDQYPDWVFQGISFNQGVVPFKDGELFLRVVGDEKREARLKSFPIVLVPGGPLVSHDYMENLEGLTAPADYGGRCRRVIEYDPVGTGLSAKGTPAATVADAADELEAALKTLDLAGPAGGPLHAVAHGSGCAALLESVARGALPNLKSAVLASPLVTGPYPRQPEGPGHFAWGQPGSEYYKGSVARGLGSDQCVAAALRQTKTPKDLGPGAAPNAAVEALVRAVEAYDPAPGLAALKARGVPVLVTRGGDGDPCGAARAAAVAAAAGGRVQEFPFAAHLAFVDSSEQYCSLLFGFMGEVDGVLAGVKA